MGAQAVRTGNQKYQGEWDDCTVSGPAKRRLDTAGHIDDDGLFSSLWDDTTDDPAIGELGMSWTEVRRLGGAASGGGRRVSATTQTVWAAASRLNGAARMGRGGGGVDEIWIDIAECESVIPRACPERKPG